MHEQACSSCVSPAISFAVDARPYPHFNDNTAIIETDTIPQSTLLSIDPNPPTTVCLPLSRSHTPDPVSDDRTAMDHVPLSRCSTGPEPEVESFTDVLVTNGKYDPATRHTTSTCTREWGYLDRSQLWLSLYLFGRRRRNHGSVSGHFSGQVIACSSSFLGSTSCTSNHLMYDIFRYLFIVCVTLNNIHNLFLLPFFIRV